MTLTIHNTQKIWKICMVLATNHFVIIMNVKNVILDGVVEIVNMQVVTQLQCVQVLLQLEQR